MMTFRNWLFDHGWKRSTRIEAPVFCVGNLTVGGTGKTPCVEWLAKLLTEQGLSVCLISRGYKSNESGRNDEAMLLEDNLPDVPHLQNPDRVAAAELAIEELEANCLVLDDGFQHRRLKRDFDLVLIDASKSIRQDWVLPTGTLREWARQGLNRANAVMLTRCDQAVALPGTIEWIRQRIKPGVPLCETIHQPHSLIRLDAEPIDTVQLRGKNVAMVCGIGNPQAFRRTLESLGANVIDERIFADHHSYSRDDVKGLIEWSKGLPEDTTIVVTQKDFVKLRVAELGGKPVMALRIGLKFLSGEVELTTAVLKVLE